MTDPTSPYDVAIIGAGIGGLALAYYLRRAGMRVCIVEQSGRTGGVIHTVERQGRTIELGPHTTLANAALRRLVSELSLSTEQVELPRQGGRKYIALPKNGVPSAMPVPSNLRESLASELLSVPGKLAVFRDLVLPRYSRDDCSVEEWMCRRFGKSLATDLVATALGGIWAADTRTLSMRSALPRLWEAEQRFGSVLRGLPKLKKESGGASEPRVSLSFRGGLSTFAKALERAVRDGGVEIRLGQTASEISLSNQLATVQLHASELVSATYQEAVHRSSTAGPAPLHPHSHSTALTARRLVIATPAPVAADLIRPFDEPLAARIRAIPYAPLGLLSMVFPRSAAAKHPEGFGVLVAPRCDAHLVGAIFTSSLFPDRFIDNEIGLTCFVGGARHPEWADTTRLESSSEAIREVCALLNLRGEPTILAEIYYPAAIPNYPLGHYQTRAALEAFSIREPRIHFLGNWVAGPAVGDRVNEAEKLSKGLCADVS